MEKLFFDREPNEVQYSKLYCQELIRLVQHLEGKIKRYRTDEYTKQELIMLCKAYYSFLRLAPKLKELTDTKKEKIKCVELKEDDFELVVPVFKKFALKSHTHDTTTTQETDKGKTDDGVYQSDGDFD